MAAPGDERALVTRLEAITQRLTDLEVQVRALVTRQTVEAKGFVVKDDRGEIRARLELRGFTPRLIFYDPGGQARLTIGLRVDGSPTIQVEQYDLVQRGAGSDK